MNDDTLWAPWRSEYITAVDKPSGCFLCDAWERKNADEELLVLYRGCEWFVILNRYPYNNGHLMIASKKHTASLDAITPDMWVEYGSLLTATKSIIEKTMNPQGMNIGINLGRVAGAGVDDHIHTHIVPRWNGDTNFMASISDTRVISQSLNACFNTLRPSFDAIYKEDKK